MHSLFLQQAEPSRWEALGAFLRAYWFILLPTVLGFLAVYWLLPRVRQSRPAWGAAAGGLALALTGILLCRGTGIWPETLLFYAFSAVAVAGGVLLVTQSNPVYAALSFALVVLSTCGLFLLNGAPFLTAATIIIYAGAIIVTFLFVIMLAQQSGRDSADLRSREPFLATLAGFVLLAALLGVLHRTFDTRELDAITRELDWLAQVKSADEVNAKYRPVDIERPETIKLAVADRLRKYLPDTGDETKNYAAKIEQARVEAKVEVLRDEAQKARAELDRFRAGWGTVAPREQATGRLPVENVAALGQTLFTDYLVPVELAAVLLLVATIGAIAIAGRRGEGNLR
jgi:NADH:ubiquinone oxidoreductase subunit 6 (subunit J)